MPPCLYDIGVSLGKRGRAYEVEDEKQEHSKPFQRRYEDRTVIIVETRGIPAQEALGNDNILGAVLALVGKGEWLFVAGVSRRWREKYAIVCEADLTSRGARECVTLYRHALAAVPKLELATQQPNSMDLTVTAPDGRSIITCNAGRYAPKESILWAKEHGLPWDVSGCCGCAFTGRLDMLKWMRQELQCPWMIGYIARLAAFKGHLHIMKWAWAQPGGQWTADDCVAGRAIVGGHLQILKWMHSVECLWEEDGEEGGLCGSAAVTNQLPLLEYLHSVGFPINERTTQAAAASGNLEMLKWLVAQDCPFNFGDCFASALHADSVAALGWLITRYRAAQPADVLDLFLLLIAAGQFGSLGCLQYLRESENVVAWPERLYSQTSTSVSCWPVSTLEWAISQGATYGDWTSETCAQLKANEEVDFSAEVEWAHAHGCPCTCPR